MAYKYHQDIMVLCSSDRSASGGVYRLEQVNEQAIPMLKPTIKTRSFSTLYRTPRWPGSMDPSQTRKLKRWTKRQATLTKTVFVQPKYITSRHSIVSDSCGNRRTVQFSARRHTCIANTAACCKGKDGGKHSDIRRKRAC